MLSAGGHSAHTCMIPVASEVEGSMVGGDASEVVSSSASPGAASASSMRPIQLPRCNAAGPVENNGNLKHLGSVALNSRSLLAATVREQL